jgi:hypothetical protein
MRQRHHLLTRGEAGDPRADGRDRARRVDPQHERMRDGHHRPQFAGGEFDVKRIE